MKKLLYLLLGLLLAHETHLNAVEQHPFIERLCAQIVSQLRKFDGVIGKLRTAVVEKRIKVSNTETVLQYLAQAQETTRKALHSQQGFQAKKMFLLPTYLETAFERTIDRWIANSALVPSDTELQLIPRYVDSLVNILSYLSHIDKKSLEQSFIDTKSTYLTLFSHCVVNSITLSLYTLKNKRLLNRVLQRLYMLKALLEEYNKHKTFIAKEPSAKEAISAYSAWTQEVIQRIVCSEISANNPPTQEPWRSKVQAAINRVTASLGRKNLLDKLLGYIVNRVTRLTITEPCFDYISSLIRCIRECGNAVPL